MRTRALTVLMSAYLAEVVRGALQALPRGQYEAAQALGLRYPQTMQKIILPQAMSIAIPTVGGYFISVLKDCALVSFIGVEELLRQGKYVISETFRSEETYFLIGIIYFVLSFTAARVVKHVENWLRPAYLRKKAS